MPKTRPGVRPRRDRRIPKDMELPPTLQKELKKAGILNEIQSRLSGESSDEACNSIDLAARRYLLAQGDGDVEYRAAVDQRDIASEILAAAKSMHQLIDKDPEVAKRFILALNKVKNEKDGKTSKPPKIAPKVAQIKAGLLEYVAAAAIALKRSKERTGRYSTPELEIQLAREIFDENPKLFPSRTRMKSKGTVSISRADAQLLEKVLEISLQAAAKRTSLFNVRTGEKIADSEISWIASEAVEKLKESYKKKSHEITDSDTDSDEAISKDLWYKRRRREN